MYIPKNFSKMMEASCLEPLRLGAHQLNILGVTETKNSYGEDMIIVQTDCDKMDDQAGQFSKLYELDTRLDKKWPLVGTHYISVVDGFTGQCSRPFAAFMAAVVKSNPGFKVNWDASDWGAQFVNLKVGGVFGRVETDWTGETHMRTELRWFCSIDQVGSAPVPKDKLLKAASPMETTFRKKHTAV